jgi:DNA-binding beta-propeller fold protein YncE
MRFTSRLTITGSATLATVALGAAAASAAPAHPAAKHHGRPAHPQAAVFVQTDNAAGNSVVAYDRDAAGRLTRAGIHPTGGRGGMLAGSVVDHLASQDSLTYDRANGLLYAVNAGSNSVTVFAVDGDRLIRRQVLPSGGDFPVSVAVHGDLVYVLDARSGGAVQGYRQSGGKLVPLPGSRRALGLDAAMMPEFTSTPGQVAFSPHGDQLLVTTKGNGSAVDVFAVGANGRPSAKPVVNAEPGAVPFAGTFDGAGRLLLAEAGPNAIATFSLGHDGKLAAISQAATGQMATCWIVLAGGHAYLSNAGSATLSGFDVGAGGVPTSIGLTRTDDGTVDAAASPDGRFLYVQTGARGIVDAFRVARDGSLTALGSVTVPAAVGGEGIATT